MIELDREGNALQVLGGKFQRRLRQVDAVIMVDLGTRERTLHLAGIAAGDVEKGERLRKSLERIVKELPYFLVGERVGISTSFW
jgi:hypothetical protein